MFPPWSCSPMVTNTSWRMDSTCIQLPIETGWDSFKCDVRKGTAVDALWFAIGANATNGARRTTADKRKAIELALVKFPEKTQEQVAKHVGCVQSYVVKIRSEIITSDIHKLPDTRRSSDGKSRPTTYKKHAKPASSIREEIENRTKKPEPVPEPREVSGTRQAGNDAGRACGEAS